MGLIFLAGLVLYIMARANYLLFHAVAEGFAIIVAALIYVLGTRSYKHSKNDAFLFLGIAYLHVALLDFLHTLTYKGMGVFPNLASDTPTQLWIAGRLLETVSLVLILVIIDRKIDKRLTFTAYSLTTGALLVSIMVWPVFPACFVEGQGLTAFKIWSEYVMVVLLLGGAYGLYLKSKRMERNNFSSIGGAMVITAAAELSFTLYSDVYGIANMVGHLLKVVSYYYVYAGVLAAGIDAPYSVMAADLKEKAATDMLTDLYNRQGMVDLLEGDLRWGVGAGLHMGALMIDLDDFKKINDCYGHLYGDEVLKQFAALLKSCIRIEDIACRYGGDEFVVLVPDVTEAGLQQVKKRIEKATVSWVEDNERLRGLGISVGTAFFKKDDFCVETLLWEADASMYASKRKKK